MRWPGPWSYTPPPAHGWEHGRVGTGRAEGFAYVVDASGDVVITHHGRRATVLRGRRAADFLDDIATGNAQELMARVTGNYKRGNERTARNHPRNRRA